MKWENVLNLPGADVKNYNLPSEGPITFLSCCFSEHFVQDNVPLIFWDVSHMSENTLDSGDPGPSGYGIRLMVNYIKKLSSITSY